MPDLKMLDLNQVIIAGRLTKDPEEITGHEGCKFSIAVDKKRAGNEVVSFFDVVLWGKSVPYVLKYIKRGDPVLVTGSLKQERWESESGARSKVGIESYRVDALSWRDKEDGPAPSQSSPRPIEEPIPEDDIPF